MLRRTFLTLCAGLLVATQKGRSFEEVRHDGYIVDWYQQGGINRTTHPEYPDPPYGSPPVNRVWLNGKEVSHDYIHILRTGPHGWIEFQERDGNDQVLYELWDNWNYEWVLLDDNFRKNPKYQTKLPNLGPRWGEQRLKVRVERGHVVWQHNPKADSHSLNEPTKAPG